MTRQIVCVVIAFLLFLSIGGMAEHRNKASPVALDELCYVTPLVSMQQADGMYVSATETHLFSEPKMDSAIMQEVKKFQAEMQIPPFQLPDEGKVLLYAMEVSGSSPFYIHHFQSSVDHFYGFDQCERRSPVVCEIRMPSDLMA